MRTGSDHSGSNPRTKLQQIIALDSNRIFFIPPTDGFLSCGFKYKTVAQILSYCSSKINSSFLPVTDTWGPQNPFWWLLSEGQVSASPDLLSVLIRTPCDTPTHPCAPQPHPAPAEPQPNPQQMMIVQSKAFNKAKHEQKNPKKPKLEQQRPNENGFHFCHCHCSTSVCS